jgi:UDP-N-acetyl-D-mannosaminuronate dehydrogenase
VRNANTLVVGLGEVGSALSQVLRRTGRVLEHDIERCEFDEPIGVMHLCIPFTRQADFEATAVSYIQRFKPELTIVNSTVVPGTSRAIAKRAKTPIAYSPVRGKHIRMAEDLLKYRKFVAASDDHTAARAAEHFRAAGMTTQFISKLETLELAKLGETTYFGVLIAFAQELNRYASRVDGDYAEALDFFEEVDFLPSTKYYPGFIGGHCVIPNIDLMRTIASSQMLEAVLESNRRRVEELSNEARIALSPDPKLKSVQANGNSQSQAAAMRR